MPWASTSQCAGSRSLRAIRSWWRRAGTQRVCHGRRVDLAGAGFDLVHPFDAHAAAREPGLELLAGRERRGLLIGNTRALWAPFAAALPALLASGERDPLERYTEHAIEGAFPGARVLYGHRRYAGAFVPLQRLAVATGLGALAPSQLVI